MDKRLTNKIARYFATQPVVKAWVFGSYARGEAHVKHPDGLKDNTHTNILGAFTIVSLLLPDILVHIPELTTHIIADASISNE